MQGCFTCTCSRVAFKDFGCWLSRYMGSARRLEGVQTCWEAAGPLGDGNASRVILGRPLCLPLACSATHARGEGVLNCLAIPGRFGGECWPRCTSAETESGRGLSYTFDA